MDTSGVIYGEILQGIQLLLPLNPIFLNEFIKVNVLDHIHQDLKLIGVIAVKRNAENLGAQGVINFQLSLEPVEGVVLGSDNAELAYAGLLQGCVENPAAFDQGNLAFLEILKIRPVSNRGNQVLGKGSHAQDGAGADLARRQEKPGG